ncbi:MAG: metalloregulator ArsR/SmtB family transcription factor [Pseudohongiella sp.]|nr:metalloregulator ArsR/SmtB family transcription factor [Pseudohongiella sp.]MDP2126103.1 metalloregulator ArsR/SmtB family transcription factor [Pseudohongiella sp.]
MPDDAAIIFAALGDNTRLNLLARLRDGQSHAIVELTDGTGLTRQAISKHLHVLENAGLVLSEKSGRESRYLFDAGGFQKAQAYLDVASAQWDAALLRLKDFIEET